MKYNHLDVLGSEEMEWFWEVKVTIIESILYSGLEDQHHRRVGHVASRSEKMHDGIQRAKE